MKAVDNSTTRKDYNENQTTNFIHDKISMSMIKKFITKPKSHQIKPKQNNITYTSLKKMQDLSSMQLAKRSKKEV